MNIQLISLRGKDEDTFLRTLRDTRLGRRFIVDCNGTFGIGCADHDLERVLAMLSDHGYHRVNGEASSVESVATIYLR